MRFNPCWIFCALAVFFFVLHLSQTQFHFNPNEELFQSLLLKGLIVEIFYGMYQLIRRLRPNRAQWRIIFGLIILIVLLVIFSVPEIQQMVQGWIVGIRADGEHAIVFAVICVILCGLCRSRPARTAATGN